MTANRVQISLSDETLARLDRLSAKSGLKRSAVVSMLINQAEITDEMTVSQIVETIKNSEKLQQVLAELMRQ